MQKLQQKLSLTDVMAEKIGRTPPTTEHGSSTIDHILISSQLLRAVTRAEYLPFKYGVFTDHRALVIDLSISTLRARIDPSPRRRIKKLNSKICPTASEYKTEMTEFLRDSGQVEKLFEIPTPTNKKTRRRAIRKLELFDRQQTKKMLTTEKKLPSRHGSMWSPMLKSLRQSSTIGKLPYTPNSKTSSSTLT